MKNIKKIVSVSSILFFAFALLFTFGIHKTEAATCTASTGNWSNPGTWSGCGSGVPNISMAVIIPSGAVVTVDANANADSIVVNNSGATTGVIISNSYTLGLGSNFVLNAPTLAGTSTLDVGSGHLAAANLVINGGAANFISRVRVGTGGTINVTGNVTFGGTAAQAQLSIAGSGQIVVDGNFNNGGTFTDAGSGEVVLDSGSSQNLGGYTFHNLVIDSVSTVLTGDVTADNIEIISGSLDADGFILTVNNNTKITNGTLTDTTGGTMNLNSLEIDSNGIFLPGSTVLNVGGATLIDSGGLISLSSGSAIKIFTGDVTINGTWAESIVETVYFGGNLINNGAFGGYAGGSHVFTGSGKSIGGTTISLTIPDVYIYGSISLDSTNTLNTSNLLVDNTRVFTNNGTVNISSSLAGVGDFINAATGVLNINTNSITLSTLTATASGNTVSYNLAGSQNIKSNNYDKLILSGSGIKNFNGVFAIANNLEINSGVVAGVTGSYGIHSLSLNGVSQAVSSYGSTSSNANIKNNAYFSGTGAFYIYPPIFTADRTGLNTIVLTFSEPVNEPSGETSAWTVAGATVVAVPGVISGTTMTLTTTGLTSTSSTPTVTYVSASGNLLDLFSNEMSNSISAVAVDHVAPVLIVALSNSALSVGQTSLVTFTFSEAVTGFDNTDVTVPNGTLSTVTVDGSDPKIYTATFTPTSGISASMNVISVGTGWTDASAAHNAPASGAISANFTINTVVYGGGGGGGGYVAPKIVPVVSPIPVVPIVVSNAIVFTQPLKQGMTHNQVIKLQKFLNATGYTIALSGAGSKGNEINIFGSRTVQALIKFQKDHGMKADGAVGPKTRELLNKLWKDSYNTDTKVAPVIPVVKVNKVAVTTEGKTFTKPLTQGVVDDEVIALQKLLNENDYPIAESGAGSKGNEINIFGSRTTQALMKFQKDNGMTADGVVGPKVRDFLNNFIKGR